MTTAEFEALIEIVDAMFEEYRMRDHWMGNGSEYLTVTELKEQFVQRFCQGPERLPTEWAKDR